ncbi:hypothetical protein MMC11_008662, partial [Xylographa trunciseda]|nr:hypothetical protein [Xylographa trunciseda]
MLSKDVATVRVSNLHQDVDESKLLAFFQSHGLKAVSQSSLCKFSSRDDSSQVATVTFSSATEAKKALSLHGKPIGAYNAEIDRDFMGITVLATPQHPSV